MAKKKPAEQVLTVDHGSKKAFAARSHDDFVAIAKKELAGGDPPWIKFADDNGEVIAHVHEPSFVALLVDGNEFYDEHRKKGRVVVRARSVFEMNDDSGVERKLPVGEKVMPKVYGFDPDSTVVLAGIRWIDPCPSEKEALALLRTAWDAAMDELETWEPPAPPEPTAPTKSNSPTKDKTKPTSKASASAAQEANELPSVRAAYLCNFAHINSIDPVGGCWPSAPTKIDAVDTNAKGGEFGGDPIACDGVVYGGSSSFLAYAAAVNVLAKPRDVWAKELSTAQSWVVRGGFIEGDTFVLALKDRLVGLAIEDGAERWTIKCAGINAEPLRFEDAYLVSTKKEVVAYDAVKRRKRWATPVEDSHGVCKGTALSASGIVMNSAAKLHAIDARTGKLLWKKLAYAQSPAIADDAVYVCDVKSVHAFELSSGKERWVSECSDEQRPNYSNKPAIGGGAFIYRTDRGSVRAVECATGKERWMFAERGDTMGRSAVTVVGDCVVFVHYVDSSREALVALELATGKERWRSGALPTDFMQRPHWYSPVVPVLDARGALAALVAPSNGGVIVFRG